MDNKMTEKMLELVVAGVDLDDSQTAEIIDWNLSDLAWASVNGTVTVATTGSFKDVVCEASTIARRIANHLHGAYAIRWFEDFVTTPEIAHRMGVTRELARLLANGKRGPKSFPDPYQHVGVGEHPSPIWMWGRVSEWLDANGYQGDGLVYPTAAQVASINSHLRAICEPPAPAVYAPLMLIGEPSSTSSAKKSSNHTSVKTPSGPWSMRAATA